MLRKAFLTIPSGAGMTMRNLAASSDGKGPKDPSPKAVLGKEVLDALNGVVEDLHKNDKTAKQLTKSVLLSKLMSHEKDSFEAASTGQNTEALDDPSFRSLLDSVAAGTKQRKPSAPVLARKEKQGMVMLRKEIFYQAKQDGFSAVEAQRIAENAVEKAREEVTRRRQAQVEGIETEKQVKMETTKENEKEQKLFELAFETAEKMLFQEELPKSFTRTRPCFKMDSKMESILKTKKRLKIFDSLEKTEEAPLSFWDEWDKRAAKTMGLSMGPENAFEQQIIWTKTGRQWPYPINNEYLLGEEENVSFIEHIFLERHLPSLGIPKTGPIAHFMHLVCVGLSKNPYMTAAKKMEHIHWFANYFSVEKQKIVHKLHEEEQIAVSQTA